MVPSSCETTPFCPFYQIYAKKQIYLAQPRAKRYGELDSPSPGEGEIGCLFDEIVYFVEPIERPHMKVWAGLSSRPTRPGVTQV